ncbi:MULTISPECIES: cysteine peptidase family C39 domain-containing protein [Acinetobacter]|uniref:cysteine peptidase family C39 domain-containing protein n=1 Tax=Acinetobacter TaxID=469 RepID=UPI001D0DA20E|nr:MULTISPECIES: cysteine peptidase family C39 domain-containing protein [Acinetobacter]
MSAPTASGAGIAASTLSPAASYEICQYFKGKDAQGSAAHILAHTILGAAVAATGGNNALSAGIAAGGAEAAAPLLAEYLYGKKAKDLTASEKSTISSIVGLAGSAVGATTGDVSSTVQGGQSAQNAVENNYQTKATLKVVNKQLQKCSPSDRGCIERGISALRKADKILDEHFKTCAQTNDASCVKNHLEQILASDASPEMKETIQLLKRLGISTETMGLLNETNGYSKKETQLVEDARAGKDLGCISGTTQNSIAPIPEKTLGNKVGTVINDMTVRQLAAVLGAEYDPLTGEQITPNERQMAKASMLGLGFTKTVSGVTRVSDDVLKAIEKQYGKEITEQMLGGNVFSPSSKNPLAKDAIPRNTDRLVLNQGQSPTCGHNSCAMVLDTLGKPVNVDQLMQKYGYKIDGLYPQEVAKIMKDNNIDVYNFSARTLNDLSRYTSNGKPVIVRIADPKNPKEFSHFVVVDGITEKNGQKVVAIRDPHGKSYFSPVDTFKKAFTGEAIVPRNYK